MAISVPIIKVEQNEWQMYVGMMKASDVYRMAKADRVRLENIKIPKYAGFQRPLVEDRVTQIRDYLSTPISTFPNSIIVSIDSEYISNWNTESSNAEVSNLLLEDKPEVLKIIDGQHRAAALDNAPDNFNVILTIFIDLDIVKAAEIFAKINSTQKAVNPSIAFQLFGYSQRRSPQKTAHDIAEILNTTEGSPFYKKLRMLGTKDDWARGTLSQSTFAKHIMGLFTKNYLEDENALLRSEKLADYPRYPFRKYFINEQDKEILSTVWKYYVAIAKTWPEQWSEKNTKSILGKTTGFASFVDVLKTWLLKSSSMNIDFETAFKKIKDKYNSAEYIFIRDNYAAGHQGVVVLRNELLKDLGLNQ